MSALSDAELAVAEAREAAFREKTLPSLDRLIRAVRHHDAETVLAIDRRATVLAADTIRDAWEEGRDAAANSIAPDRQADLYPEVEVRFADGPTVRIARYSVTTDAETGSVAVEGFIAYRTGQPHRGDAVRLAYVGIPGRGALADVTASVELFSRLEVLNIRIRTTIDPKERP